MDRRQLLKGAVAAGVVLAVPLIGDSKPPIVLHGGIDGMRSYSGGLPLTRSKTITMVQGDRIWVSSDGRWIDIGASKQA